MKQDKCIFCKIINGEVFSRKIWEDENHLAVLTPFPNTPGFTVIFSKKHYSSNVFSLPENICVDFMRAARTVAQLLDKSLGCKRTGMIVEGMAIDHAHIKLVPMHGIPEGPWEEILSNKNTFTEKYLGFLTSNDGPPAKAEDLDVVFNKIIKHSTSLL